MYNHNYITSCAYAIAIDCPYCGAAAGKRCKTSSGGPAPTHSARSYKVEENYAYEEQKKAKEEEETCRYCKRNTAAFIQGHNLHYCPPCVTKLLDRIISDPFR